MAEPKRPRLSMAEWESFLAENPEAQHELERLGSAAGVGTGKHTHARSLDATVAGRALHEVIEAAKTDDELDAAEAQVTESTHARWERAGIDQRKDMLRKQVQVLLLEHFGIEWQEGWIATWIRAPWLKDYAKHIVSTRRVRAVTCEHGRPPGFCGACPPSKRPSQPKIGRSLGDRAFAIVWQYRAPAPFAFLPPGPFGSTVLTERILAWVSILAGNWPRCLATAGPLDVLQVERATIHRTLLRYGRRPGRLADGEVLVLRQLDAEGKQVVRRLDALPVREPAGRPKRRPR